MKTALRDQWRDHMPEPGDYYVNNAGLSLKPGREGWAQGKCPFHSDKHESLSVNLTHGGWKCFAGCGQGDLLSFHMRLTGLDFKSAASDLSGVEL
jgi:DNA primase